ncbi:NADAR domain-containing protein [Parachlamydia acanthamoebae]|uniref:NADAR domain-containing protein n=1 Tax=Parachlamydia acanthamoebae TaxID=83552 RepID=UPI0003007021|nr:NADAR domain-containing protein [Parachlamydia acanthamoebae]
MSIQNSVNAIFTYTNPSNDKPHVLRLTKDKTGNEQLKAEKKNAFTRFKMFLGFKSYNLDKIVKFVEKNHISLENHNKKMNWNDFYAKIGTKILIHNKNHPKHLVKISNVFANAFGGIEPKIREMIQEKLDGKIGKDAYDQVMELVDKAFTSENPQQTMKNGLSSLIIGSKDYRAIKNHKIIELFSSVNPTAISEDKIRKICQDLNIDPRSIGHVIEVYNQVKDSENPIQRMKEELFLILEVDETNKLVGQLFGKSEDPDPFLKSGSSSSTSRSTNVPTQTLKEKEISTIAAAYGWIGFYKSGPSEFLGNFALCPNKLSVFGKKFDCAEAAFQWRKFDLIIQQNKGQPVAKELEKAMKSTQNNFFTSDGEGAFQISRRLDEIAWKKYKISPVNWRNGERDKAMWEILENKFKDPTFNGLLRATNDAYLLEHNNKTGKDYYWSDNNNGEGFNMLGKMLMHIRDRQSMPKFAPLDPADPEKKRFLKDTEDPVSGYANLAKQMFNSFNPPYSIH